MNYPKITVITPSYNQGAHIEQTILSILNQGYPNLEYIVIDGKSTDNTLEIIAKYQSKIIDKILYFVSEKNNGLNDAINKGLSMATGEIISILNAGDYYEPYALFKVATTFTSERINVVCGRGRVFKDKQATQETIRITEGADVFAYNLAKTIGWASINQPETFFRKIVVNKIGLLNINIDTFVATDWWIRYLFAFGVENIIKTMDLLVNVRENVNENTKENNTLETKKTAQIINRDTFYYLLASRLRLYDYSYVIKNNSILKPDFDIQNTNYQNDNYQNDNDALLSVKSLNYFALLRANEAFAEKNIIKTKDFLKQVQQNLLDNEDKKLYSKLSFKTKLPNWLREIF